MSMVKNESRKEMEEKEKSKEKSIEISFCSGSLT